MEAQDPQPQMSDSDFKLVCDKTVELKDRFGIPGVAVGVFRDGQSQVAGLGVTHVENPLAVNEDTLFQIGSITKTFTGTVIMRLMEAGQLDLDTPLRTYMPDLGLHDEDVAARVTLRHLLTHTGGWLGDYFDDMGWGDDALARMVRHLAELPQLTPLGEIWSYNNAGFYLAGRLIEVVTGQTYEAVVQEMVLAPLGMEHSFFMPADVMTHRFVVGHHITPDGPKVARPWPVGRAAHPAGGLVASVSDLFKYAQFHLQGGIASDGTRLLSEASVSLMQTPQVSNDLRGGQMGLSWFMRDIEGMRLVYHGGGTNGQVSLLSLVPTARLAIVVLTNGSLGGMLTSEVTKFALSRYLGVAEPEEAPQSRDEASLASYLGRYVTAMNELELSVRDGSLWIQVTPKGGFPTKDSPPLPVPPPVRAAFLDADRIVALDPPFKDAQAEFLRATDGGIAWLRFGGRVAKRQ